MYVAYIGIHLDEMLEASVLRRYLPLITSVALCCCLQAIVWVLDIVLQVEGMVGHAHELFPPGENNGSGGDEGTDVPEIDDVYIRDTLVPYVAVNASIHAAITVFLWVSAVIRARLLLCSVEDFMRLQEPPSRTPEV
jgi:hypothetical protein